MLYELTTISSPPLEQTAVSTAARNWVLDGEGRLLGAWRTELGELFQIKLLRGFETAEALEKERLRALMSAHPFSIDDPSSRLSMERYARFPFLPDVEPLALGGFYEFLTRTPDMVRKSLRGQRWVLASGRRTRSMPG